MSLRLRWALALALIGVSVVVDLATRQVGQAAQNKDATGSGVASLKDQLEKGLRARRPVEFQFVRRVAQLVDSGDLTVQFVQGSFSWTVKKYEKRKYLVPYFEQVLRQRAKAEKITVLDNIPTTFPSL